MILLSVPLERNLVASVRPADAAPRPSPARSDRPEHLALSAGGAGQTPFCFPSLFLSSPSAALCLPFLPPAEYPPPRQITAAKPNAQLESGYPHQRRLARRPGRATQQTTPRGQRARPGFNVHE